MKTFRRSSGVSRRAFAGYADDARQTTCDVLNTQCFSNSLPAENPVKNHARNKDGGKKVCQQSECQGYGKTFDRPCTEQEQNRCRNYSGNVRINDRDPGMLKTLLNRRR